MGCVDSCKRDVSLPAHVGESFSGQENDVDEIAFNHPVIQRSHWSPASAGITGTGLWPIHATGNYIFVGGQSGGVFRSSDNGNSWQAADTGLTNTVAYALASVGTDLFVGTGGAVVLRSTKYGNSWTPVNNGMPPIRTIYALHTINTILVAGTSNGGVFVSTNRGGSWLVINNGLTNQQVFSLASNGQDLFAGTSSSVFRREHRQLVVSVRPRIEQPTTFTLAQNYPNPFNPSTVIRFDTAPFPDSRGGPAFVSLKVYNLLGEEITTLVNQEMNPGRYTVPWNAHNIASGVYLYRLQVSSPTSGVRNVQTKKMLLIR